MAFALRFEDAALDGEIKFRSQPCLLNDPQVAELVTRLHAFRSKVDLATFTFELDAGDVYDYGFDHKDGRRWHQKLDFAYDGPDDPGQSFDTHGDRWLETEFKHHRMLRDAVVALHNWRPVDSIEVTFA